MPASELRIPDANRSRVTRMRVVGTMNTGDESAGSGPREPEAGGLWITSDLRRPHDAASRHSKKGGRSRPGGSRATGAAAILALDDEHRDWLHVASVLPPASSASRSANHELDVTSEILVPQRQQEPAPPTARCVSTCLRELPPLGSRQDRGARARSGPPQRPSQPHSALSM